jgi:hypothetical protein
VLDAVTFNKKTLLRHLEQPPEEQTWDIAVASNVPDVVNFPTYMIYDNLALDGGADSEIPT